MAEIVSPGRNHTLVEEDGTATQLFSRWMQRISEQVSIKEGSGIPEGAVDGYVGWLYFDDAIDVLYIKLSNGGPFHWRVQAGVVQGHGDPNGVQTGVIYTDYLDVDSDTFYKKATNMFDQDENPDLTGWIALN